MTELLVGVSAVVGIVAGVCTVLSYLESYAQKAVTGILRPACSAEGGFYPVGRPRPPTFSPPSCVHALIMPVDYIRAPRGVSQGQGRCACRFESYR